MDVRQMRQVVAIATHKSFVRAAAHLGISQPTLSRSIARLEDELGLILFDRSLAGVRPTPIGEIVAERSRRIIDDASRLKREAQLLNAGQIGQVRIGFGMQLGPVFVPRIAAAIAERYPDLRQRLIVQQRRMLLTELISGQLDLIIVAAGKDLAEFDLHSVEIMRQRMVAVAAPHHPLAGRKNVDGAEFAKFAGVAITTANIFLHRDLLSLELDAIDHSSHVVTNEFHVVRALVVSGNFTAIGQAQMFDEDIKSGNMVVLDINHLFRSSKILASTMQPGAHSTLLTSISAIAREVGLVLEGDAVAKGRSTGRAGNKTKASRSPIINEAALATSDAPCFQDDT